eukprot:811761_1
MSKLSDPTILPGNEKFILIDNRLYDVTSFRHPGGSIIKFFIVNDNSETPRDATDTWNGFHARSDRARRWLKVLPSKPYVPYVPPDPAISAILTDFRALKAELEAEGLFEPSVPHMAYRFAELAILLFFGVWLIHAGWSFTGCVLLGVMQGRVGWVQHEAGHFSLTGRPSVDIAIQQFTLGIFNGLSSSWWRSTHNKHHAGAQHLGHDPDLETLPLVAFNMHIASRVGNLGKWWIRLQTYMFPMVSTMLVVFFWLFFLHPRRLMHLGGKMEIASIVLHYILVWVIFGNFSLLSILGGLTVVTWVGANYNFLQFPLTHTAKPVLESEEHEDWVIFGNFSLLSILGGLTVVTWVGANYNFLQFPLTHTAKPVLESEEHEDWVTNAALRSTNINPSWWCDWMMGYLNYQIEHHLFPSLPQFRSRRTSS